MGLQRPFKVALYWAFTGPLKAPDHHNSGEQLGINAGSARIDYWERSDCATQTYHGLIRLWKRHADRAKEHFLCMYACKELMCWFSMVCWMFLKSILLSLQFSCLLLWIVRCLFIKILNIRCSFGKIHRYSKGHTAFTTAYLLPALHACLHDLELMQTFRMFMYRKRHHSDL